MSESGPDQVLICPGSDFDQFWIMYVWIRSWSGFDLSSLGSGFDPGQRSGSDQVRISSGSCVNQVLICSRSGLSLVWIRSRLGSDQFRIRSRLGSEKIWIKFNFKIIVSLMQIFDKKSVKQNVSKHYFLWVYKGQIISECPFEILDFPKIPRKIWQISALESEIIR